MSEGLNSCACQDADEYLCWGKRYSLGVDATSTIRAAVITDGGPCQCWCHDEDEWADYLAQRAEIDRADNASA